MRLKFVFCSVLRTHSWLMESTTASSTSLSASRRSVQRQRPSGAWLQAVAINFALYVAFSWWAGGSALRGRIEDGRHFVIDQRERYAAVSRETYYVSLAWGWLVVGSVPVLLVAGAAMRRIDG